LFLLFFACVGSGPDHAVEDQVFLPGAAPWKHLAQQSDLASVPVDLAPPIDLAQAIDLAPAIDMAQPECQWGGAPGMCLSSSACAASADHTAKTGCSGGLFCCIVTPNVADNPPIPAGYKLMTQAMVTTDMTNWAVMILHDPVTYPMFSTTTRTFGTQLVLARVEWHPPDFQNSIIHRGVTLYIPI
jgi:hypothetical protein